MSPPEKWTGDEKGRDVNFFLDEVTAFNERTVLPQVFWAEVAQTHLHWRSRKSWDREMQHSGVLSGQVT